MPVKTSYTESEIKTYMQDVLGDTASKLGLSAAAGDFDEAVNEVLYLVEQSDFSWVTTLQLADKARTISRMEAWRSAMYFTAHEASYSAGAPGTGQTSRADIHRHCKAMFELAQADAFYKYPELAPADAANEVAQFGVDYENDYYGNAA